MSPDFLDIDDVAEIHKLQMEEFGGIDGLRDRALLESAVAQPRATFGGELLHQDLAAMAAAYLFHIVKNHPFIDGNKRTGLASALTFLELNGIAIEDSPRLFDITMDVSQSKAGKEEAANLFRELVGFRH